MNETEKLVKNIEDEISALKASFEQSATTMPIFTKSVDLVTTRNKVDYKFDYQGQTIEYDMNAVERVMVTFTTSRGSNTIAALEIDVDNLQASPEVRRVPFSGGARWIVMGQPHMEYPNWLATVYRFTVHSMVDGVLTAENMSS